MTNEEQREKVIQDIAHQLRINPFKFEFKVVKKPKGIKVIYEVTQDQLDYILKTAKKGKDIKS